MTTAATAHAAAPSTSARPQVTHVLPRHTSTQVQPRVTIIGRGFRGVRSVWFGTVRGRHLTVVSHHLLRVTAPREEAGRVRVRVVTRAGTSSRTHALHFTYREPPPRIPAAMLLHRDPGGTGTVVLSWQRSGSFDLARVIVERKLGSRAPDSPYDGTRVKGSGGGSTSLIDSGLQIGKRYTYAFFAQSESGVFSRPAVLRSWIPRGAWTSQRVDPFQGFPDAISCVGSGFCAAGDASGKVVTTHDGSTWSPPVQIPSGDNLPRVTDVYAMSCASAAFCVAGVSSLLGAQYSVFDGSTWSVPRTISLSGSTQLDALSCIPGTTTCLAGLGNDDLARFDGTTWSVVGFLPDNLRDLSCPTTTYCMGITGQQVYTYDHGVLSGPTSLASFALLDGVSCGAEADCVVLSDGDAPPGQSVAHHLTGGTWTSSTLPAQYEQVSCLSSTWCLAAADTGESATFDGTTWTATGAVGTWVGDLSCATSSQCVAVEPYLLGGSVLGLTSTDLHVWRGSTWATVAADPARGGLSDISCGAVGSCVAVDPLGNALALRAGSWSAPTSFDSHAIPEYAPKAAHVSCPTYDFCAAVRSNGYVSTYDGTSWSPSVRVDPTVYDDIRFTTPGAESIDCVSSTFCVVVNRTNVLVLRGSSWSAPRPLDSNGLEDVSCASTTRCVAVDAAGKAVVLDGSHWSAPTSDGLGKGVASVSCPTATFCLAASRDRGRVATLGRHGWSPEVPVNPSTPGITDYDGVADVTCTSATSCSAYDDWGAVHTFDGSGWSAGDYLTTRSQENLEDVSLTGLSCAAPGWCRAVSPQIAYARGS